VTGGGWQMNKVALRRAGLVLRCVTVRRYLASWYLTSDQTNSAHYLSERR